MIIERQVSDALNEIRHLFAGYRRDGHQPTERELAAFERILQVLSDRSHDLETEVTRLRFCAVDRREHDTDALLAEVSRPDSNVTLFRMIPRPHFGGAA